MGQMGQNLDATQRQQLLDQLAVGQYQDQRNQQQLDFDYEQYQNEQAFPATYLDNLNRGGQLGLGIANATATGAPAGGGGGGGSRNPLAAMIGGGLSGFLATGNPWGAAAGAGMGLLGVNDNNSFAGLGKLLGDSPTERTATTTNPSTNYQGGPSGSSGGRGGGRVAAPSAVNGFPSLPNSANFQAGGGGGGRKIGQPQTGGPLLRPPAQVISQNVSPPLAGKASGLAGGLFGSGAGGFGGAISGALNNATQQAQPISSNKQFTLPNGNVVGTGLKLGPLGGFGGFGGFGMV